MTNGTRPQTRDDLLSFCCQPIGECITVDYRKCWIDDRVISRGEAAWKDETAILLYFDPRARPSLKSNRGAPAEEPNSLQAHGIDCSIPDGPQPDRMVEADFFYVPIRYARVLRAQNHDASMTFWLELQDWYRYSADSTKCVENLKEREPELFKRAPLRPRPGREMATQAKGDQKSTLVVWDEDDSVFPKKSDQPAASWTSTMLFLRSIPGLTDCVLACCLDPTDRGASSQPACALSNGRRRPLGTDLAISVPGLTRARVRSGSTQLITLHLIPGEKAGPQRPEIQVDPAITSVVGPITRQRNAGSEVTFELAFAHQLVRRHAFMQIRIPLAKDSTKMTNVLAPARREGWDIAGPTFSVDIEIVPAGGIVYGFIVSVVASAFLGSIDLGVCRSIAGRLTDAASPGVIDDVAIRLLIAIKFAAVLCAFVGSWIAVKHGVRRFLSA